MPRQRHRLLARLIAAAVAAFTVGNLLTPRAQAAEPSFRRDVMAVLSRSGCNQGTCHGNQNGKGGFKLSLRGQDPELDLAAITHDQAGRRINLLEPAASLLLLKPSMQVGHEGGRRFKIGAPEYEILRRWIADGALDSAHDLPPLTSLDATPGEQVLYEPQRDVQLKAIAHFADGSTRDVTQLAVYEVSQPNITVSSSASASFAKPGEATVLVRYLDQQRAVRLAYVPQRTNFVWRDLPAANEIDRQVLAKLKSLRINPAPLCDDSVFLRRAFLDSLGILPTASEAKAFIADAAPDKRIKLIDALLVRPEFADHWALKWSDLLRNEEKVLDFKGVRGFHNWLRESFAANKPLDQLARELVAARGSTYKNPPANYYRANRDAISRAEATAQVFLGVRLQCAKCHNHPFDHWTQADYYGWASVFSRVDYKIVENRRPDDNDKHQFEGEQIVIDAAATEINDPRTNHPRPPRLLDPQQPALAANADRLETLAAWLTSPSNRLFAQAQTNRIWFHLMGRGIVDPIDDFRGTNPPSHPALLDKLTDDFVSHHYDLRYLVRTIMNSRTYQAGYQTDATNADDEINYSHCILRRLSAEQLLDAVHQTLDLPSHFAGYPAGLRAGQLPGVLALRAREAPPTDEDRLLTFFGKPPRLLTCECERSNETALGQAFQLISGPTLQRMLTAPDNRLARLSAGDRSDSEALGELFAVALAREPTGVEYEKLAKYLDDAADRRAALEDVTWGILNSKEFLFRH